jgi:hypothetical protein
MMKRYNFIALLLIQAWLGYEFLISGWNKIAVNSSFTKGLAGYLKVTAGTRINSYASFINHYILPHGTMFGYLIEWAEVICGVILILAAPVLFVCLNKKAVMHKTAAVLSILSLAGILLMSLNFYWMTGAATVLPGANPYIPGVSFDFFIVILSLVLIVWNATLLKTKTNKKD